jgi:hypothetical protein
MTKLPLLIGLVGILGCELASEPCFRQECIEIRDGCLGLKTGQWTGHPKVVSNGKLIWHCDCECKIGRHHKSLPHPKAIQRMIEAAGD